MRANEKVRKNRVKPGWFRTASLRWLRFFPRARLSAAPPAALPPLVAASAHSRRGDPPDHLAAPTIKLAGPQPARGAGGLGRAARTHQTCRTRREW